MARVIEEATAKEIREGLSSQLKKLKVVPSVSEGKRDGFLIFAFAKDSIASLLGFQNGDVVRSVNGISLAADDGPGRARDELARATRFEVDVLRKKSPLKLLYEVRSVSKEERASLVGAGLLVDSLVVPDLKHPPEDLDVYRRALYVRDEAVQRAVVTAVSNYPEGFDLLSAFIEKNLQSAIAVHAASTLAKIDLSSGRTLVLKSLLEKTEASKGAFQDGRPLKYALLGRLAETDPAKYAPVFLDEIAEYLNTYRRRYASFDDRFLNDINSIAIHVPKERLYPLVPKLLEVAEDSRFHFSDRASTLANTLALITGQRFFSSPGDFHWDPARNAALEKYREYYYTKMSSGSATPK